MKKKCQIFRVLGLYTIFLLHTTILKPFYFHRVPLFFTDYPRFSRVYQDFTGTIRLFSGTAGVAGCSCSAARIAFTVRVRFLSDNIYESKITDMKRKFNHKKIIVGVIVTAYLTMLIGGIVTVLSNLDSVSYGIY